MKTIKTISGEVSSVFPELNCFEINSNIFFHGVKTSTVNKLRLGKKITVQYRIKKIKSGDWIFKDFIFLKFLNNNINKTTMKKEYTNTEKIIREGVHSETKEKYTLGVRARFGVSFQYFEISKHPKFDDECVYTSRKFFFLKNNITDDEKKEIEKFENDILNKFYYGK